MLVASASMIKRLELFQVPSTGRIKKLIIVHLFIYVHFFIIIMAWKILMKILIKF